MVLSDSVKLVSYMVKLRNAVAKITSTERFTPKVSAFLQYAPRVLTFATLVSISLGVTAMLISIFGLDVSEVFHTLFYGAFGTLNAISQSLNRANPILLCGLGLILAYRCGIWNVGAEGQLYVGALVAVVTGLFISGIPKPVHIFIMLGAGFAGGTVWGLIPAYLRVKFNTNILITTLLMNFVGIWLVYYAVRFPLKSEQTFNPITDFIEPSARLPLLIQGQPLHAGFIISILLTFGVWYLLEKTVLGYRIKAIGANPLAARYSGIPDNRVIITTMILSAGLCGLAGMGEVSGVNYILHQRISADFGFLAIAVVFIGRLNPWGVLAAAIFFGGLLVGARVAQATHGLPLTVIQVFLAMWMIALLMGPAIESGWTRVFGRLKKAESIKEGLLAA